MLSAKSASGLACGSVMMVKCFFSDRAPAFSSASAAVSTCIKVSAVPPDFEMAIKCVFLRSKRLSAAVQENGSGLS